MKIKLLIYIICLVLLSCTTYAGLVENFQLLNSKAESRLFENKGMISSLSVEEENLIKQCVELLEQNPKTNEKLIFDYLQNAKNIRQIIGLEKFLPLLKEKILLEIKELPSSEVRRRNILRKILADCQQNQKRIQKFYSSPEIISRFMDKYSQNQKKNDEFKLEVLESNSSFIRVKLSIPHPDISKIKVFDKEFDSVTLKHCGETSMLGFPKLPVWRTHIALEVPGVPDLIVESSKTEKIENIHVEPVQMPLIDGKTRKKVELNRVFVYSSSLYESDNSFPEKLLSTSLPGNMRALNTVQLSVNPVMYFPKKRTLEVYRELTFRIDLPRGGGLRSNDRGFSNSAVKDPFSGLYQSFCLNKIPQNIDSGSISRDNGVVFEKRPENGAEYIVLTPGEFSQDVDAFIEWKREKGIYAKKFILEEVVSDIRSPEMIAEWLRKNYWEWNLKPSYLLLIGDVEKMPCFKRRVPVYGMQGETIASDYPYSLMDERDLYPDVFVGRLSVDTNEELQVILDKIIQYEKYPVSSGKDYLNRTLCVGVKEQGRIFHETQMWVADTMDKNGYQVDKVFSWENGGTDGILASLNQGVGIVTYRGHGEWDGWIEPSISVWDIEDLNHPGKYPVIFSITCLSGAFADPFDDCFGEQMMYRAQGGAVGFLGASKPSYSFYNDVFEKGAITALMSQTENRISGIMVAGQKVMIENYGAEDNKVMDQMEFYSILTDPSLVVYHKAPQLLSVSIPDDIQDDFIEIGIQDEKGVPVDDATLTMVGEELYQCRYSNKTGNAVFKIEDFHGKEVKITVTAPNSIPYIQMMRIP